MRLHEERAPEVRLLEESEVPEAQGLGRPQAPEVRRRLEERAR